MAAIIEIVDFFFAKFVDFELAKNVDYEEEEKDNVDKRGTFNYMSPELVKDELLMYSTNI